jgi:hypothetical protein
VNKIKFVSLMAALGLALAFTLSCSSDNAGGGTYVATGSCIVENASVCGENVSQAECLEEDGIFSSAPCDASYNYCLSLENYLPVCNFIGNADMPSKASCPADEDGSKTFTNETICGGPNGSCIFPVISGTPYNLCLDINKGLCELFKDEEDEVPLAATFQAGECSTAQYPCCFLIDEERVEYFAPGFSKNDCYAIGMPANASFCELLGRSPASRSFSY